MFFGMAPVPPGRQSRIMESQLFPELLWEGWNGTDLDRVVDWEDSPDGRHDNEVSRDDTAISFQR